MNSDWKDALGALMGDLPQGDAPAPEETPAGESRQRGRLRVMRDKRRGGKIATIIDGFTIADDQIEALDAAAPCATARFSSRATASTPLWRSCAQKATRYEPDKTPHNLQGFGRSR